MDNVTLYNDKNQHMDVDLNLKQFGYNFVHEYYTVLSKFPHNLSKYYKKNSIFVHRASATKIQSVVGQKAIHDCIVRLGYKGCNTNIHSVNTQNVYNYIVISVVGELIKRDSVQKKFSQTIVLDHNDKDGYIIKNNMFFYSDDTTAVLNTITEDNVRMSMREWKNKTMYKKVPTLYANIGSLYPPISHQLFVSGIPADIKPQDLRQFFERYGELHSLRIMKKNVNYGFITYAKPDSTMKVLQNRPILFPDKDGVWLVVKEKRNTPQEKDNVYLPTSHQLFIGDIPDNVTSEDLKHFFSMWGDVVNARIMATEENLEFTTKTVHGFVTFETEQSAKTVLNNRPIVFPNENGVELKVMEKLSRSNRHRYIERMEFMENSNDDESIFVCF